MIAARRDTDEEKKRLNGDLNHRSAVLRGVPLRRYAKGEMRRWSVTELTPGAWLTAPRIARFSP